MCAELPASRRQPATLPCPWPTVPVRGSRRGCGCPAGLQMATRSPDVWEAGTRALWWAPLGSCWGWAGLGLGLPPAAQGRESEKPLGGQAQSLELGPARTRDEVWMSWDESPRAGWRADGAHGAEVLPAARTPQLFCREGPGAQGAPQLTVPLPDPRPWGDRRIQGHLGLALPWPASDPCSSPSRTGMPSARPGSARAGDLPLGPPPAFGAGRPGPTWPFDPQL